MEPGKNPVSECDVTREQIKALMRDETITVTDRDGDTVTVDGAQLTNGALQMILDGYPEQVTVDDIDLELLITDDAGPQ